MVGEIGIYNQIIFSQTLKILNFRFWELDIVWKLNEFRIKAIELDQKWELLPEDMFPKNEYFLQNHQNKKQKN